MIRGRAKVLVLAAAAAGVMSTVLSGTVAHGDTQRLQRDGCRDIGNGTLCVEVVGAAGTAGKVGIGYWKHAGRQVEVRIGWKVDEPNAPVHWNQHPQHELVSAGGQVGTYTSHTYLNRNCVVAVMRAYGGEGDVLFESTPDCPS